jgi:hypothetical protein
MHYNCRLFSPTTIESAVTSYDNFPIFLKSNGIHYHLTVIRSSYCLRQYVTNMLVHNSNQPPYGNMVPAIHYLHDFIALTIEHNMVKITAVTKF